MTKPPEAQGQHELGFAPPQDATPRNSQRFSFRFLDGEGRDATISRVDPPQIDLGLGVRFNTARMRLALIAGARPDSTPCDWTLIAKDGTQTVIFESARLYAFTRMGKNAGLADAQALSQRLGYGQGCIWFVWRVLVEGPFHQPEAVTPVWIIEGHSRPVPVTYHFD